MKLSAIPNGLMTKKINFSYLFFWGGVSFFILAKSKDVISPQYTWWGKLAMSMFWMSASLWLFYYSINLSMNIPLKWANFLGVLMFPFFLAVQIWWLIIWFELSLLPILLIIVGFGSQSVRFPAALYMMIYTLVFSLPSMAFVVFSNWFIFLIEKTSSMGKFSLVLIFFMFMVKIPVFGLHLWLPKAHVESPTLGSMILAGVLLKMGVAGLWLLLFWSQNKITLMWFLVGGTLSALIAVFQSDLKRVIAYSSVSHLNISLATGLTFSSLGESSLILLALLHGSISSALFFIIGLSSYTSKSRMVYFLKINSSLFWLLALGFNMGLPPCPSFWPELFGGSVLTQNSLWNLLFLFIGGVGLAWFSILNWLNLKFSSFQILSGMSKIHLSLLWASFILWMNLIWFF